MLKLSFNKKVNYFKRKYFLIKFSILAEDVAPNSEVQTSPAGPADTVSAPADPNAAASNN
jgi:hypothetical protein